MGHFNQALVTSCVATLPFVKMPIPNFKPYNSNSASLGLMVMLRWLVY